jgi:hypothetical protein
MWFAAEKKVKLPGVLRFVVDNTESDKECRVFVAMENSASWDDIYLWCTNGSYIDALGGQVRSYDLNINFTRTQMRRW